MHTFLKVSTSSSLKCAIVQLYPATWLFSHPALPVLPNLIGAVDAVAATTAAMH